MNISQRVRDFGISASPHVICLKLLVGPFLCPSHQDTYLDAMELPLNILCNVFISWLKASNHAQVYIIVSQLVKLSFKI